MKKFVFFKLKPYVTFIIKESSWPQNQWVHIVLKPQNQRVQKVMSQRSAGSCTRCTRANAFPVLGLILRKMITNCESIFINEQYIIMSSYSFLLYTKLTSIHYVVLGYDFIRIKNWEEWMKAFSIWHKGSFVFFRFLYDRP